MYIGADGFLHKPVTASHLVYALQQVFVPASAATPRESHDWASLLRGLSVLVVENNEINQQVARELLASAQIRWTWQVTALPRWNGSGASSRPTMPS